MITTVRTADVEFHGNNIASYTMTAENFAAEILAARIEGLQEALKIVGQVRGAKYRFESGSYANEPAGIETLIRARIADLENR